MNVPIVLFLFLQIASVVLVISSIGRAVPSTTPGRAALVFLVALGELGLLAWAIGGGDWTLPAYLLAGVFLIHVLRAVGQAGRSYGAGFLEKMAVISGRYAVSVVVQAIAESVLFLGAAARA